MNSPRPMNGLPSGVSNYRPPPAIPSMIRTPTQAPLDFIALFMKKNNLGITKQSPGTRVLWKLWVVPLLLISLTRPTQSVAQSKETKPSGLPEKRLMAVFAHPDDETTMGGSLARLAHEGVKIQLVTITSGQKGG